MSLPSTASRVTAVIAEDEPMLRTQLRIRLAQAWPELVIAAEAEEREAIAQLLEGIAAGGERLGCQVVSRPRRKRMRALRAAAAAGKARHDRGALVVRLEGVDLGARARLARVPFARDMGARLRAFANFPRAMPVIQ